MRKLARSLSAHPSFSYFCRGLHDLETSRRDAPSTLQRLQHVDEAVQQFRQQVVLMLITRTVRSRRRRRRCQGIVAVRQIDPSPLLIQAVDEDLQVAQQAGGLPLNFRHHFRHHRDIDGSILQQTLQRSHLLFFSRHRLHRLYYPDHDV